MKRPDIEYFSKLVESMSEQGQDTPIAQLVKYVEWLEHEIEVKCMCYTKESEIKSVSK